MVRCGQQDPIPVQPASGSAISAPVPTVDTNQPGSSAKLLFEETFEGPEPFSTAHSKDVGNWTYALQYVTSPAFRGNRSARFEIREDQPLVADGKRSEVTIVKGSEGEVSRNAWYGFAVYFPSVGYAKDSEREIINQWYQDGSPATSLRTEADKIILETGNTEASRKQIVIGAIEKNKWHKVVIHFIHSYESDGLIELWYDGVQKVNHKGGNMYNDVLPKWKIGLYKSAFKHGTSDVGVRILFFDNIRVGNEKTIYADVNPAR
jgi:hypothetical protein